MPGRKNIRKFPCVDWYCDSCNDYLNNQSGLMMDEAIGYVVDVAK